jgi:hypothetical protein
MILFYPVASALVLNRLPFRLKQNNQNSDVMSGYV